MPFVYLVKVHTTLAGTTHYDWDPHNQEPDRGQKMDIISIHSTLRSANRGAREWLEAGNEGNADHPGQPGEGDDIEGAVDARGYFRAEYDKEPDTDFDVSGVLVEVVKDTLWGPDLGKGEVDESSGDDDDEEDDDDGEGDLSDPDEGEIEIVEPPRKRARQE